MGSCISNINKDHFFAYEGSMKNNILFFKGNARAFLEMCARCKTYTELHSIKKYSNIMTLVPLQTGVWWRDLFKDILCCLKELVQ